MTLSGSPGALKKFRGIPWKVQRTFKTPLGNLMPFVDVIVSSGQSFSTASVTIEQAVFEPKHWIDLLTRHSLQPSYKKGVSVAAAGREEIRALLHAALSDWIDFIFVPNPRPFAIYADHDEYTTFFAHTRSNLNRVCESLQSSGFEEVVGYVRRL